MNPPIPAHFLPGSCLDSCERSCDAQSAAYNSPQFSDASSTGGLAFFDADATILRSSLVGGAATAKHTTVCAAASAPTSAASLTAGLGGAVFASSGRLSIDGSALRDNVATSGGGLFATNATVTVMQSVIEDNTAASGGAAVLGGTASLVLNGTVMARCHGAFAGALMLLDGSSAVLASSRASQNSASVHGGAFFLGASASISALGNVSISENRCAGGGGIVYARGGCPAALSLIASPNIVVANNTAGNWGHLAATDSYVMEVSLPSAITGWPLSAKLTILDGFNQTINGLNQSTIVASCPTEPAALKSPFVNSYERAASPVTGLVVTGPPGHSLQLQFVVAARDLLEPLVRLVNVTIAPCGPLEVW